MSLISKQKTVKEELGLSDPKSYVSRLLNVKDTVRIRPYLGTNPNLRYVPVTKEKI